jgi:putative ABC transport system ATP-binding protein
LVRRIELDDIYYSYVQGSTEQSIFSGLSYALENVGSTAILGRSGCGKSTLLNLLCGIDRPQRGRICIDQDEISAFSESQLALYRRRNVGIVFQAFNLVPTLTVGDNLRLPLELNDVAKKMREQRVDEVLERVGMRDLRERYPEELSGGEQQRVAVARSVVHKPKLVLADEPTGSLDAQNGMRAIELIRDTAAEGGHALLIVTHSRAVASYADTVLTLNDSGQLAGYREGIAW